MISPQASYVCENCRQRKKACDKKLPRCSYCQSRDVPCVYISSPPAQQTLAVPDTTDHFLKVSGIDPVAVIGEQLNQLLARLGQEPRTLANQYFESVHAWIPFMCRKSFCRGLNNFPSQGAVHFSGLLIAVCLVGRKAHQAVGFLSQSSLHISAKMMLIQLQTLTEPSRDLISATALIGVHEYLSFNSDAALATISMAIRMAYTLEATNSRKTAEDQKTGIGLDWLWWMLIICERLFVVGSRDPYQPLLIPVPPQDYSYLDDRETQMLSESCRDSAPEDIDMHAAHFLLSVKAIRILDEALKIVRTQRHDTSTPCSAKVADLEVGMFAFLHSLLETAPRDYCDARSTTVMAIHVLYRPFAYVDPSLPQNENAVQKSRAALDTVANIMLDVAIVHRDHPDQWPVDARPPSAIYILRSVLEDLSAFSGSQAMREVLQQDLSAMLQQWHPIGLGSQKGRGQIQW